MLTNIRAKPQILFIFPVLLFLFFSYRLYWTKTEAQNFDDTNAPISRPAPVHIEALTPAPVVVRKPVKVTGQTTPRIGSYTKHWYNLAQQIMNKTASIAMIRYGDGELALIRGDEISAGSQAGFQDKWSWDRGQSKLGKQIHLGLKGFLGENIYYGLPLYPNSISWFLDEIDQDAAHITYANLWVNNNYKKTVMLLEDVFREEKVVLVVNEEIQKTQGDKLNGFCKEFFPIPDDGPRKWETIEADLLQKATEIAQKYTNTLFVFSAGPLAKGLIPHMFKANKQNRYIDFGSSTDHLLKGRITRPFVNEDQYGKYIDPDFEVEDGKLYIYGPGYPGFTYNMRTDEKK